MASWTKISRSLLNSAQEARRYYLRRSSQQRQPCNKNESDKSAAPESAEIVESHPKQVRWAENLVTVHIYPPDLEDSKNDSTNDSDVEDNREEKNTQRFRQIRSFRVSKEYIYATLVIFAIIVFLMWYLSR